MRLLIPIILTGCFFSLNAQEGLQITGFVDASVTLPFEDDDTLYFSSDQFEVDLEKNLTDGVSIRADIDFFVDGAMVEQAYVSAMGFTFGWFNAPIGFELLDAPDMYQYSHSLVFDNALPTNLSGVSYARDLMEGLDVVVYAANGWDVNTFDDDQLIFGGRLGYVGFEGIAAGLSAIQMNSDTLVIDVDATVTMIENLIIGVEFNTGGPETGWLVMTNYSFGRFGLTLRQDTWGDLRSTTISPSFSIVDGAGLLFEFRIDTDMDGSKRKSSAIELTFSF